MNKYFKYTALTAIALAAAAQAGHAQEAVTEVAEVIASPEPSEYTVWILNSLLLLIGAFAMSWRRRR